MKAKRYRVKNIRWAELESGFRTKIGDAGKQLVAFSPDSFGGCWFSIQASQVKEAKRGEQLNEGAKNETDNRNFNGQRGI